MKILGVSAFFHDSSSAIVVDGKVAAASQEERFTRMKHDSNFPSNSIISNLEVCQMSAQEIEAIVFFEKPFFKFERLLETYLAFAPAGINSFLKAMPVWIEEKLFQKKKLIEELLKLGFREEVCKKIYFSEHHLSHAASAFYPSPFDEAIVLTMDGVGEFATTSVYLGKGNSLTKESEIHFPHSLGMLYSAFTYYCGFKVNSGEYKLMGLAPYGVPRFAELIKDKLIDVKDDGSFRLNLEYFDYCTGLTMTNKKFDQLFGNAFRGSEDKLEQVHMDLAASIQFVLEEVILKICRFLKNKFQIENLCLAGGVALNCVANGRIEEEGIFKNIWIQPASGDAGGALGAALELYHGYFKYPRVVLPLDSMEGAYLGPQFTNDEIEKVLSRIGAHFEYLDEVSLFKRTAEEIVSGKAIGWFQGRMEFGPRSLGNRSILADARYPDTQKNLNLKTKFRESFRPFAPAVLYEDVQQYFNFSKHSPYMLMVGKIKDELKIKDNSELLFGIEKLNCLRSSLPAITHVDFSARIQTVTKKTNERFYHLIKHYKDLSNVSVLVNTSFNVRGEPIVCTPEDAYRCFMGTNIEVLVLNNYILLKENQPKEFAIDYKGKFALD